LTRRIVAMLIVLAVGVFFTGFVPEVSGAVDYSIVRVRLSSMGSPKSLKIEVKGNYSIPENKNIYLENKVYDIGIENGKLILKDGSTVHTLGTKFTFKQHKGKDSDCLVIQNPSYGKLNYKGDMVVKLDNGIIRLTNHIYLETYLYGVVPSEMPNSWHVEALKAQAVAARTYAVRNKKTSSSYDYDLVDTQSSQVYMGYNSGWGNSINAVNETAKKVLKYGGGFTHTFYSSSNGGWIEAGHEVFSGISKSYEPLLEKEDPHDPVHVWSINLDKTQIDMNGKDPANPDSWWGSVSEKGNSGNYASLITTLKNELKSKAQATDVKIISIDGITLSEKTVGQRYKNITFTLSYYAKKDSAYITDEEGNIKAGTADVTITTVSLRSCVGSMIVRSYYINDPVLQKEAETGREYYVVSGQGFGHGVGMSQYGAKAMAEKGHKYTEILDFYYPKSTMETLNISPPVLTDKPPKSNDNPGGGNEQPPNEEDEPSITYGKVKVQTSLNVRQGPGTQYARIGSLGPNVRIQILGQEGQWYKIKYGNLQGYVHSDYVELEKDQQNPNPPGGGDQEEPKPPVDPVPPPNNDERKYAVVTASALNVRSGPSTKNHKVGMVVKGARLTVLGQSGSWYRIEYNGITGYVSGQYVKLESSGTNQPPSGSGQVIDRGTVTATALNVRSGAGTGYSIIGSLKKNAKVEIVEKVGSWYKIKYGNGTGYVSGQYVKLDSSGTTQPPSRGDRDDVIDRGTVTATALNVRSGAGTGYSIIGSLKNNAQVEILEKVGSWYKIKYGNGTGYVSGQYVKLSSGGSSQGQNTKTGTVTASALYVRSGAGTNYSQIGYLLKNTKVEIVGQTGSWYKIKFGSGTGYVSSKYIKV
jgi:stage II sporulation protein D